MRIDIEDLEFSNQHIYEYQGKPFTGTGVQLNDEGNLWSEIEIQDGLEHGKSRDYHRNGELHGESRYETGFRHGYEQEWSSTGALSSRSLFLYGVLMWQEEANELGELVRTYVRPENDSLYAHVKRTAEENGQRLCDIEDLLR